MRTLFIFYVIFSGLIMVGITLTTIECEELKLNIISKILCCLLTFSVGFVLFPIFLGSIMIKVVAHINKYK